MSDSIRSGQFTRTNGSQPGRDTVQPRFHTREVQDQAASANAGRAIYKTERMVQFLIPASPNQPVFRLAEEHIQRWPEAYARFMAGQEMSVDGTPLEQWPILNRAMVLELKALEVHTVEQCADLSDNALQRIGRGGYSIRDKAKAYLDDAERIKMTEKLSHENDGLRTEIADLQRQLGELRPMVDQMYGQLQAQHNMPHPVATFVQGQNDPLEAQRQAAPMEAPTLSALDAFEKRGPGRPRKAA